MSWVWLLRNDIHELLFGQCCSYASLPWDASFRTLEGFCTHSSLCPDTGILPSSPKELLFKKPRLAPPTQKVSLVTQSWALLVCLSVTGHAALDGSVCGQLPRHRAQNLCVLIPMLANCSMAGVVRRHLCSLSPPFRSNAVGTQAMVFYHGYQHLRDSSSLGFSV